MPPFQRDPRLPPAGTAGDHDAVMMDAHPHVLSRDQKAVTVPAELPADRPVYPHPLAHGDPPGQFHTPVAD
jgi:hypothetical protein